MYKYVLVLALIVGACSSPQTNQEQSLTQEELEEKKTLVKAVMKVHDEAMPWMDDIHLLRKNLKLKVDSMSTDSLKTIIDQRLAQLDEADEAMMSWMRQYREPGNDIPMDSIRNYLQNQEAMAKEMRSVMKKAIEDANTLMP